MPKCKNYMPILNYDHITSVKDLPKLPQEIGESLWLNGLTTAEGLKLPQKISRSLYLIGLTTAKGLKLPQKICGDLCLENLPEQEKEQLRKKHPDLEII